ncbi:hypothetical protein [Rubinisphaera sp.]|uniref:hypothetical protein n=1 Tax=Rubinisphaera sp. TaxID=2024857 RepID=UPI000C0F0080|nr:hypothetical protein [Rubinisphaera sp.]MBV11171.1 hypothetical protein [Rubinisphaera sp.]HCS52262.1 hypothetical protein [Planctomycetaceae bacterium]|tara:strand:- start:4944 stop:5735 length:792 start_codon:yes stop_codon:yes gene_type:complete
MATLDITALESFGFRFGDGGTHLARTMMFDDVARVLQELGPCPNKEQVVNAVDRENLLGKPSGEARRLATRHLVRLYSFDRTEIIYRALTFLWERCPDSQRLLALLCAYARDPLLRHCTRFLLEMREGQAYDRDKLSEFVEDQFAGRYSPVMLTSVAQRLAGTWTQSGHLQGRSKKKRVLVTPTPGAVTFALLLGYLNGNRGILNFESEYVKLLDCSPTTAIELAKTAARRGWVDVKHVGSVVEVAFPRILTEQELEAIREQG